MNTFGCIDADAEPAGPYYAASLYRQTVRHRLPSARQMQKIATAIPPNSAHLTT